MIKITLITYSGTRHIVEVEKNATVLIRQDTRLIPAARCFVFSPDDSARSESLVYREAEVNYINPEGI